MCRVSYITKNFKDKELLTELFTTLDKSMGGDGIGLGWFETGIPIIFKGQKLTPEQGSQKIFDTTSDHGYLFHTRRASVGSIDNNNCHPFIWDNTITMHNGHIDGAGVLKLMMFENLEKYAADGWTQETLTASTDSNIMAYFIWKKGFNIVSMLSCGTVVTMYPDKTLLHAGNDLEAIKVDNSWIFASEFTDAMGMSAREWLVFIKDTEITVKDTGECIITKGFCVDGKKLYLERKAKEEKKKKKNRKFKTVEVD